MRSGGTVYESRCHPNLHHLCHVIQAYDTFSCQSMAVNVHRRDSLCHACDFVLSTSAASLEARSFSLLVSY
jgi:hypothetical protein